MLDDLRYIHEKDAQDALGVVGKQWQQLTVEIKPTQSLKTSKIDNVVLAGMGGSALGALIAQAWPSTSVPFEVVRDYQLPAYVNQSTLVICSSYSGNTEETLSALEDAKKRQAQIVAIAAGGQLQQAAEAANYPLYLLPKAGQPRYSVLANFRALLEVLSAADLLHDKTALDQLPAASQFLQKAMAGWAADVPTKDNPAKKLAQELMGKSVVVYSGHNLSPTAYKWKISVNENAKQVAWLNQLPEFNHNEFIGWSKQPVQKPYAVVDLRSQLDNPRVQKRFEVSARLLSGLRPEPIKVEAQGQNLLEQILWTGAFGDFVTIYLALLNGINPAPVDLVEKFKKALTD